MPRFAAAAAAVIIHCHCWLRGSDEAVWIHQLSAEKEEWTWKGSKLFSCATFPATIVQTLSSLFCSPSVPYACETGKAPARDLNAQFFLRGLLDAVAQPSPPKQLVPLSHRKSPFSLPASSTSIKRPGSSSSVLSHKRFLPRLPLLMRWLNNKSSGESRIDKSQRGAARGPSFAGRRSWGAGGRWCYGRKRVSKIGRGEEGRDN